VDDKEVVLTQQDIIIIAEAVEKAFEKMKEIFKAFIEQMKPIVDAVEDMFQKVLETDEEVLEEIMLYSNPSKKELLKMILEYKKIYKRYEPP